MTWNQPLIPKAPPEFSVSATGWGSGWVSREVQFQRPICAEGPGNPPGECCPQKGSLGCVVGAAVGGGAHSQGRSCV